MSFFQELKRRNVLRAAGAYVAVSWLILQVAETLLPAFDLEDAVLRTILIVLGIGFVPAIAAAWAFELTAKGLVRDEDVDRTSTERRRMDKRLDRLLVVVLALAVAYFAVDKFVLDPARDRDREAVIADAAAQAALSERREAGEAGTGGGPSTLAVLPFTAVGDNEDSRFFATGVHDDLLTRLAKLGALRVISRTSVMKYKDTTLNIRDIGAALGADAILEGGVQTAGDRIRINAQLIETATDEHLWAETYDRELTTESIFEVQADISQAIAAALQATISAANDAENSLMPTENMAAYRAFHEATALRRESNIAWAFPPYQSLLRRALELDPGFTRAATDLVGGLSYRWFNAEDDPAILEEIESLLGRLRSIAPDSTDRLIAQAYYTYYVLRDYDLAFEIVTRAEERAPSDLEILSLKSYIQRRQGDFLGKLETSRLQRLLDPEDGRYTYSVVGTLINMHRYAEALTEARDFSGIDPYTQLLRISLEVMEHGSLKRRAAEAASLHEAQSTPRLEDLAELYIEARGYSTALELLSGVSKPYASAKQSHYSISSSDLPMLFALWLSGDHDLLNGLLPDIKAMFERYRSDKPQALIGEALLDVLEGDPQSARRALARWQIESFEDPASRGGNFSYACRVLGMAGAAIEAVDCLRTGLAEPSRIMPFIDLRLPHYDSIRESPEFQALLSEHGVES